jgi:steroid delta-isomerase-like uncharacterized protein
VTRLPQLAAVPAQWRALRDEAQRALATLPERPGIVPLFPAPPGGPAYAARAPIATGLCRGIRGVVGAALLVLAPGERRAAGGGFVTALLPLVGGAGTRLVAAGAPAALADGELAIVDGALEARNDGAVEALVLLLRVEDAAESPASQLVRRLLHEVFVAGGAGAARRLAAPGPAAELAKLADSWRAAFPDLQLEVTHLVAAGAQVACAFRARGTQTGPFYNLPATGAAISWSGAFFVTVAGGAVVELASYWDLFELLQQLRAALRR